MTAPAPVLTAPTGDTVSLPYQPALDGIRGLAIALVLLFHGGASWMTGGYVGVSVFFTLSGYLITTLLVVEIDRTGRVDLGRFIGRRVRRLLPASLVCLLVVIVGARVGWFVVTDRLRGDVIAAALQVANWRALTGEQSYADLVAAVGGAIGPVDHFWSLSIEEQFYWVWPAVCLVALRRIRAAGPRVLAILAATAVAAVSAPLIARRWGPDAAYWSTPARLSELLMGALLAVVLVRWRAPRWSMWAGPLGLLAVLWAAVTWPSGHGPAYTGWLPVFAVASAAVILGVQVGGPLQRAMAVRPMVELGRISYGVYLYHWPIFALLTASRVGVDGVALFAVRIVATLAVAVSSLRLVEQPIRHASWPVRATIVRAGVATAVVVALAVVAIPRPEQRFDEQLDTSDVGFVDAAPGTTAPTSTPAPSDAVVTAPVPVRPIRLLWVGDSTAVALGAGLVDWARSEPDEVRVESVAAIGCGLISGAPSTGDDGTFAAACDDALGPRLDTVLASGQVDMAAVLVTLPDAGPRVWDPAEGAVAPDDPRYIERRASAYDAFVERLLAAGVQRIAVLTPAVPASWWLGYDPANTNRVDVEGLVAEVRRLADRYPDHVTVVDFDDWLTARELVDGRRWRSDGLHVDRAAAPDVVDDWLADELRRVADAAG